MSAVRLRATVANAHRRRTQSWAASRRLRMRWRGRRSRRSADGTDLMRAETKPPTSISCVALVTISRLMRAGSAQGQVGQAQARAHDADDERRRRRRSGLRRRSHRRCLCRCVHDGVRDCSQTRLHRLPFRWQSASLDVSPVLRAQSSLMSGLTGQVSEAADYEVRLLRARSPR